MEKLTFIYDMHDSDNRKLIEESIRKYGSNYEHDYLNFLSYSVDSSRSVFVRLENGKGCKGMLVVDDSDDEWELLSEPLCADDEKIDAILALLRSLYRDDRLKSLHMELSPKMKKELMKRMTDEDNSRIKVSASRYHFYSPVISLESWDPKLESAEKSKLRKAKNRFMRMDIEIVSGEGVSSISEKEAENLVHEWRKNRKCRDFAIYKGYISFLQSMIREHSFDNGVKALAIRIKGKLCGIAAGWKHPADSSKICYSINLHNYSLPELGDFMTAVFLDYLKSAGYKTLDFGNSDEKLLSYKRKFGEPISMDEVVCFYVRKKKQAV